MCTLKKQSKISNGIFEEGTFYGKHRIVETMTSEKRLSIDIGSKDFWHSEISVNIEKNEGPTVVADVCHLPFREQSLQRVFLLDVIEHIPSDRESPMLAEIYRILNRDGEIILTTPHDYFFYTLLDPAYWVLDHRHYKKKHLTNLIKSEGFHIDICFTRGGIWNAAKIIWYALFSYTLGWKYPGFLLKKIDQEYDKQTDHGYHIFLKAKKNL